MICMSPEQMARITPHASRPRLLELLTQLEVVQVRYDISTAERLAAFVAQWAHETGEWKYLEELWGPTDQQKKYERPVLEDGTLAPFITEEERARHVRVPLWQKLGNFEVGDGKRFRGRGLCMLTGRSNYNRASRALDSNFIEAPELLTRFDYATLVAGWFWHDKHLNQLADRGDFASITLLINGGATHLRQRFSYYRRACDVLGLDVS